MTAPPAQVLERILQPFETLGNFLICLPGHDDLIWNADFSIMSENDLNHPFSAMCSTPVGRIGIMTENDYVVSVAWLHESSVVSAVSTGLAGRVAEALHAWLSGTAAWPQEFALRPRGTEFQLRVWQALRRIPSGQTRTYGELARSLRSSPRAVGNACRNNPLPLLIPCHRVVSVGGIGGFSGHTDGQWLEIKQWLLEHES